MDLLLQIEKTAEEQGWRLAGRTLVLAVSGGPDSMVMLDVFRRLAVKIGCSVLVAHVNYRLRGEESDADERLVRSVSAECRFPFFSLSAPEWMPSNGNFQAWARKVRYDFFADVAARHQAKVVVTGHHLDDQAETVLQRVLRGTGVDGLVGIPIARTERGLLLIRPFLHIPKEEILHYAEIREVAYRIDRSNLEKDYTRNEMRRHLLGEIERMYPGYRESLSRLSQTSSAESEFLHELTLTWYHQHVERKAESWAFSRASFLELHVALQRRLIKLLLNYLFADGRIDSYSMMQIDMLRQYILRPDRPNFEFRLSSMVNWIRAYDILEVRWSPASSPDFQGIIIEEYDDVKSLPSAFPSQTDCVWFDADEVVGPLVVRRRRAGDRLEPIGMSGSKKVKDLLIDEKLQLSERDRLPLVFDAEGRLLWVPGIRRSRFAPVTDGTKRLLVLSWVHQLDEE